jgi:hypothetical protein
MKKPVIYYDKADGCIIFESAYHAGRYIEPIDFKNGSGIFYDSEGRVLQAFTVVDERGIENTVVEYNTEENFNKSELRKVLIDLLEHANYPRLELEKMELSSLVRESLKFKTD